METQNRQFSLFGIPLKLIITCSIFIAFLTIIVDPGEFTSFFDEHMITGSSQHRGEDTNQKSKDIVATPDMVSEAINKIKAEKGREVEQSENISPTQRYFYIVELDNGGDIEASDVTIDPNLVTITSTSGIETVIARTAIKDIRRYRLPDHKLDQP